MTNMNNNNPQSCCIVIEGELTIYTARELKDKLLMTLSMIEELELDLSEVSEIDAAGLQLLVMLKSEVAALGKILRIVGHSPLVLDLLDLSRLSDFFGDPLPIVNISTSEGKSI